MDPTAQILVSAVAAGALAAGVTPFLGAIARRSGIVSPPRPDRWGSRPTPLLGGVAILVAIVVPTLLFARPDRGLAVVLVGAVFAFLLGLVDDLRRLRPTTKLVGQVAIASLLAIGGIRADIAGFPPAGFILTVFWVVAMMNAVNLVDNMDGLAAGVAAIAAVVLVVLAPPTAPWSAILAAALVGSCLGFLVHNFAPARIYMGDAGSLLIGYLLAALALLLTVDAAPNIGLAIVGPLLVLGLPIFDTALVALTRRAEGRPVAQGGRDHTSHRLAALGLSEREAVLVLYGVAGALALLGLLSGALGFVLLPLTALVVVSLVLFGVFLAEAPAPVVAGAPLARRNVLGAGRTLVRFGGEIGLDVALATVALFSSFLIRFEAIPAVSWVGLFAQAAPVVIPIQIGAFLVLDVYRTLWRFLSLTDIGAIVRASFVGTLAAGLLVLYPLGMVEQSKAVFLLDFILLTALVAFSRLSLLWLRHWFALRPRAGDRRVLIVGATENGEIALRLLLRSVQTSYHPAGFLDDDPGKIRRRIAGVPVLGRVSDLDTVARRERADLVILANDGDPEERSLVRAECAELGIEVREFERFL